MSYLFTLLPISTGTYDLYVNIGGATKKDSVRTDDGNTTYIYRRNADNGQSFNIDDLPDDVATIVDVKVIALCARVSGSALICPYTRYSGTNDFSFGSQQPTGSYTDVTFNPATAPGGGAWSKTIINSTEIGTKWIAGTAGQEHRVTYLRMVVEVTLNPSAGAGAHFANHIASVAGAALGLTELLKLQAWLQRTTGSLLDLDELRALLKARRVYA